MDLPALKAELTDDPLARGYAGMSAQQAADSLNAANRSVGVDYAAGGDLWEAVVLTEYLLLVPEHKALLNSLIAAARLRIAAGSNTRAALLVMFGAGTATRANLAALAVRAASRAEELRLDPPTAGDVQRARALAP